MARRKNWTKAQQQAISIEMLELHLHGWAFRDIGDKFGCSHQRAYELVQARLALRVEQDVRELRATEIARLDMYLEALEPAVREGRTRPIEMALRAAERRAKLLALDAPSQVEVTVINEGSVDEQIKQLVEQLSLNDDQSKQAAST